MELDGAIVLLAEGRPAGKWFGPGRDPPGERKNSSKCPTYGLPLKAGDTVERGDEFLFFLTGGE